jgi:hypothetical protein
MKGGLRNGDRSFSESILAHDGASVTRLIDEFGADPIAMRHRAVSGTEIKHLLVSLSHLLALNERQLEQCDLDQQRSVQRHVEGRVSSLVNFVCAGSLAVDEVPIAEPKK